jgi:hypothetical protein
VRSTGGGDHNSEYMDAGDMQRQRVEPREDDAVRKLVKEMKDEIRAELIGAIKEAVNPKNGPRNVETIGHLTTL